jgi:DNA primase
MHQENKASQAHAAIPYTGASSQHFDIAAIRHDHPIEDVVAASGVELTRRGQGFMGCCPFHDDSTASLSVGGVPDRFHCFGCGVGGDVIEYVHRFTGLTFPGAVHALQSGTAFHGSAPSPTRPVQRPSRAVDLSTTPQRARTISNLAWEFFTTPANISAAEAYLREERGIDIGPLCTAVGGEPIAGYATTGWHALTRHLRHQEVTETELLELDLARRSRTGELIDTYRGRLIVPVLAQGGGIDGFIGRDTTGDPRAPKYRNPTRTPTFDKSTALYRPTHHGLDAGANVVVVEGVLDALAIAAAAAQGGELAMFAPVTTSGVTVSAVQARAILALHPQAPIIALDGDLAGREGTDRWLTALSVERRRTALVTRLPDGVDPAEWLQHQGARGLQAFDRREEDKVATDTPHPALPGRDLVRICLDQPGEPVDRILEVLTSLAAQLSQSAARELIAQAEHEMTARGGNLDGRFAVSARAAISQAQHLALTQQHLRAMATARNDPSQLSTETPRRDAHQVA